MTNKCPMVAFGSNKKCLHKSGDCPAKTKFGTIVYFTADLFPVVKWNNNSHEAYSSSLLEKIKLLAFI